MRVQIESEALNTTNLIHMATGRNKLITANVRLTLCNIIKVMFWVIPAVQIYSAHSHLPEALGETLGHPPHLVPFHVQTAQKNETL